MKDKGLFAVVIVPVVLLLIPLAGNLYVDGWNWDWPSFVLAWAMFTAVGFAYRFVTSKAGSTAYRVATGIALLAGFMIVWGNLAVGLIGSEDNPANLMYGGVLAVAGVGALLARFEPAGMSRAMLATAATMLLVPIVALLIRPEDFAPGVPRVFGLNAFFAALFGSAALLYHLAARRGTNT